MRVHPEKLTLAINVKSQGCRVCLMVRSMALAGGMDGAGVGCGGYCNGRTSSALLREPGHHEGVGFAFL